MNKLQISEQNARLKLDSSFLLLSLYSEIKPYLCLENMCNWVNIYGLQIDKIKFLFLVVHTALIDVLRCPRTHIWCC